MTYRMMRYVVIAIGAVVIVPVAGVLLFFLGRSDPHPREITLGDLDSDDPGEEVDLQR